MINAVIDLSHHNKVSSFAKLGDSGVMGVIHKSTQGLSFKDPTYKSHMSGDLGAGMLVGAYHFEPADEPAAQAGFLLSVVGDTESLVVDFESNPRGQDMTLLEAEHLVHEIFEKTGRYPDLFSGHTIKEGLLAAGISSPDQIDLSKYWLGAGRYGPPPLIPKVWDRWSLWQYTDGAAGAEPHAAADAGRCDRNKLNGTVQDLQASWHGGS